MDIKTLRTVLGLSRSHMARFLGVSEATVIRWESVRATSEPKGLQAVLLQALIDAVDRQGVEHVARVVRSSNVNHMSAIRELLSEAG